MRMKWVDCRDCWVESALWARALSKCMKHGVWGHYTFIAVEASIWPRVCTVCNALTACARPGLVASDCICSWYRNISPPHCFSIWTCPSSSRTLCAAVKAFWVERIIEFCSSVEKCDYLSSHHLWRDDTIVLENCAAVIVAFLNYARLLWLLLKDFLGDDVEFLLHILFFVFLFCAFEK